MTTFLTDSLTDANNTVLTSHTPDSGGTWVISTSNQASGGAKISSNSLVATTTADASHRYTGSPPSADYYTSLDYTYNGGPSDIYGVTWREAASPTNTKYVFQYYKGGGYVAIWKTVAGTTTQIGATAAFTPTNGATYRLTGGGTGSAQTGYVQRASDGYWLNSSGAFQATKTACCSVTDSAITAAGFAGIAVAAVSLTNLATLDGISASDSFLVTNASAGGGTGTGTGSGTGGDASAGGSANVGSATGTSSGSGSGGDATGGTAGPKYTRIDATDTITGQNIMVLVPNSNAAVPYNAANPTGVILYLHGSGENQTGLVTETVKFACRDALLDAGYILAGTNAHGNNWGNQSSVDDHAALEKYVRANYNVKGVALWGQSMGGLDALSVVAQGKIPVLGALLAYPVCNLANLYSLGGFTSAINTAYGITGTGNATYANLTYGMDPVLKPASAFRDTPMRFYASAGDTTVPKANNTDALIAIVGASRAEASLVVCSGNHGDASHFVPSEYVAFFDRVFRSRACTITVNVKNEANSALSGLSGIRWVVRHKSTLGLNVPPIAQGTGETTDGSGVLVINFTAPLSIGDVVDLELTTTDGTPTQNPSPRGWCGPVAVA